MAKWGWASQGKLSRQVMGVVTDREHGLFPKPGEIRFDCSCPDWATMCKHVAAVRPHRGSIRRTARRDDGDGVSLGNHARAAQPAHAPAEHPDVPVPALREVGRVIRKAPRAAAPLVPMRSPQPDEVRLAD